MSIIIHNVERSGKRCTSIIIPTPKEKLTMTAEEARKITTSNKPCTAPIYIKIKDAANKGEDAIHHYLKTDLEKKYADYFIYELKQYGYKVTRERGDDQRDGTSWDYLCISW